MTGEFTLEEVRNRVEKEVNSNKKEGQANKRIDTRHIVEFLCRKTVDEQYTFTHVGERAEDADEDTDMVMDMTKLLPKGVFAGWHYNSHTASKVPRRIRPVPQVPTSVDRAFRCGWLSRDRVTH